MVFPVDNTEQYPYSVYSFGIYAAAMKKKALIIIALLLVLVGFSLFRWVQRTKEKVFIPPGKPESTGVPKTIADMFRDGKPITIALVGYGGGTHEGTYLTDTIMAVHLDPTVKKASLFSIPRDLYVHIPTDSATGAYHKINAAYTIGLNDTVYSDKPKEFTGAQGGGRMVASVVSKTIGQPVDAFVGIDFAGFTKIIDTLGGVQVRVEAPLDDPQYPIGGKETDPCGHTEEEIAAYAATASAQLDNKTYEFFPCRYEHLQFDPGIRRMDGETALKFVRSRHSLVGGSDFNRAKRQQSVLVAVKEKVFSVGFVPKIVPVLNVIGDSVRTDLAPGDITAFVQQANEFSVYTIDLHALTDENYLMYDRSEDGQSILIPKAGRDAYGDIHAWVAGILRGASPSASVAPNR